MRIAGAALPPIMRAQSAAPAHWRRAGRAERIPACVRVRGARYATPTTFWLQILRSSFKIDVPPLDLDYLAVLPHLFGSVLTGYGAARDDAVEASIFFGTSCIHDSLPWSTTPSARN